ncbi:MAG: CheR family methyltransferase, partial [Promethearchaeota archaeon]
YFGYKYTINNDIKNNVEFINEDATLKHKKKLKYDIVFCRYLLIYFNRENRDKFLRTLENQLTQGGLLFLGKTETIFNSQTNFKLVDTKNHIYLKT